MIFSMLYLSWKLGVSCFYHSIHFFAYCFSCKVCVASTVGIYLPVHLVFKTQKKFLLSGPTYYRFSFVKCVLSSYQWTERPTFAWDEMPSLVWAKSGKFLDLIRGFCKLNKFDQLTFLVQINLCPFTICLTSHSALCISQCTSANLTKGPEWSVSLCSKVCGDFSEYIFPSWCSIKMSHR